MNLIEMLERFPDDAACRKHLEELRWPGGVCCPRCGNAAVTRLRTRSQFTCTAKQCRYRFSATSGTVFHSSHLPLRKWFLALLLVHDMKKGTPSLQIHRELDVSRECAWHMVMRLREAMRDDWSQSELFRGIVQCDEHYHGGSPRKMKGVTYRRGRGTSKQPIFGAYEVSTGSIRTRVVPDTSAESLGRVIAEWTDQKNTELHTDEWGPYRKIGRRFKAHSVVRHNREYVTVDGVHNNAVENAWSLFARSIMGSFHRVSAKHLPRYLGEFESRFNARGENGSYFDRVLRQSCGRRLPMKELVSYDWRVAVRGASSR